MIKWIKKQLRNWVNEDLKLVKDDAFVNNSINSNGFNLRVYKASGGTVIETNIYDRVKDRHHTGLYVITDDKDLGNELNKIITMENLKA